MKNRETLFATYNQLANLLGLKENSIRKIYEKDPGEEVLYIFHDDEQYAKEYGEGAQIIRKRFDNNILNKDKDIEHLSKAISAGLKVSHSSAVEYLFDFELNERQKGMIDTCFMDCSDSTCWERQSGATTCAMFEALYLSMVYGKTIVFMNDNFLEQESLIERITSYLNDKRISYSSFENSLKFKSNIEGTILFITKSKLNKLKGLSFDKIIGDNLDSPNRKELERYNVRLYRTF